ncbi:MAG: hypothetical protein D3905_13150 [Candidatus Electrothrix sp. AS4_5]|nr:hypothetical protein [Candidatus Electrothrix gigas]
MRYLILFAVVSFTVLGCFTSQSFAEKGGLSLHHEVVSIVHGKTETTALLDVTVRNSGGGDLSDVTLTFNENGLFVEPERQGLYVGSLATEEEMILSWEITSHPNPQLESFLSGDIAVIAAAFDADAQSITIQVNSQGGAK